MKQRRHLQVLLLTGLIWGFVGCAALPEKEVSIEPALPPLSPWNLDTYAQFVAENMAQLNQRYSDEYAPYTFIVDTPYGSSRIQELLSFDQTAHMLSQIGIHEFPDSEKPAAVLHYVQTRFTYQVAPNRWVSTADTAEMGRGDCKGLSLLLLTLLEAAGIPAYAAISNGHMWTNAYYDGRWHVLEIDTHVDRNRIYQLAGFYDKPLYKIYTDQTLKRIPLKPASQ